jgi:hypothetical protein
MFHNIPQPIFDRMQYLARVDAQDRKDDTPHWQRLRQVPPQTGQFIDCYEAVVPNLVPGGLLVADNVDSHRADLQPMLDRASDDPSGDALVVPIGLGVLLCRKA